MSGLPSGWVDVEIGEIAEVVAGGTPKANDASNFEAPGAGIAWLTHADLSGYKAKEISHGSRDLSQKGYESCSAKLMPKGSLLFSSRAPIGYVALAANEISTNQGFKSFVFPEEIDPSYAFYYLKSIRQLADSLGTGTTFKELSGTTAKTLPFRMAPENEQTRIAQKLDELLPQVDTLKARIDGIPALLKRFRQSVLAAAVSGRLIDVEDVTSFSIRDLVTFKQGVQVAVPDQIESMKEGYVRFLRIINYTQNSTEFKFIQDPGSSKHVAPDDVVMVRYGAPGYVGRGLSGVLANNLFRVIPLDDRVSKDYLYYYLRSPVVQSFIAMNSKGATMQAVSFAMFDNLNCPVFTVEQQTEIVRRVEQLFAFADQLEAKVASAKSRIDHLTQSILAKAFRGELVPQDPSDEPASLLLERIQAQRAATPKAKRGRKASA